jgi:hypothetical protein
MSPPLWPTGGLGMAQYPFVLASAFAIYRALRTHIEGPHSNSTDSTTASPPPRQREAIPRLSPRSRNA